MTYTTIGYLIVGWVVLSFAVGVLVGRCVGD